MAKIRPYVHDLAIQEDLVKLSAAWPMLRAAYDDFKDILHEGDEPGHRLPGGGSVIYKTYRLYDETRTVRIIIVYSIDRDLQARTTNIEMCQMWAVDDWDEEEALRRLGLS